MGVQLPLPIQLLLALPSQFDCAAAGAANSKAAADTQPSSAARLILL
jgi:hypothetical protein